MDSSSIHRRSVSAPGRTRALASQAGLSDETFPETQASVETNAGSLCSARKDYIGALFLRAFTQEKTTGIDTMSIEGAPKSYLAADSIEPQPPAHKSSWVRFIVYLVLVTALGLIIWQIYKNQKQNAANSASQAAALMGRPVPVQVAAAAERPMPIFLTALGTVTPYMSRSEEHTS